MHTPTLSPVSGNERFVVLDFLRGIALFGILVVNMKFFNTPLYAQTGGIELWSDTANTIAQWFTRFFFEGKFYPLFAVLFGIGFYQFMQKAGDATRTMFVYRKRLGFLFLFGVLHVLLFWHGDILIFYALFGFVLSWFSSQTGKTLLVCAVIFALFPLLAIASLIGLLNLMMAIPEAAVEIESSLEQQAVETRAFVEQAIKVYSTGSFSDIFHMRMQEYSQILFAAIFIFPNVLSAFLIGFYLGKKKIFQYIKQNLANLRKVFYWFLPIAIVCNTGYVYFADTTSFMSMGWGMVMMMVCVSIGGIATMFVYVYLLSRVFTQNTFRSITTPVAKAGRMALSNYLAQTLICTTLFYGYGFGLYGSVNIWQGILVAIAIYIPLVIGSHYWLKRFRYGPAEWLWRSLTYNRRQSMRLRD